YNIQVAVPVHVAEIGPHGTFGLALLVKPDPRRQSHLLESSAAVVSIEEVLRPVIGNEDIDIPFVIFIAADETHAFPIRLRDPQLPSAIAKDTICCLLVEPVGRPGEYAGRAVTAQRPPIAEFTAPLVGCDAPFQVIFDEELQDTVS